MRSPQMRFHLPVENIHRFVLRILLASAKRSLAYTDLKRFRVFLKYLVCSMFQLSEDIIDQCEKVGCLSVL